MHVVQMKYFAKTRSILFFILLINPCQLSSYFFFFLFFSLLVLVFLFSFLRTIHFLDDGVDRGVAFELSEEDISQILYPAVCFACGGHQAIMRTKGGGGVMFKPAKH